MKLLLTWPATADELRLVRKYVPEQIDIATVPARPYWEEVECDHDDMKALIEDADAVLGWTRFRQDTLAAAKKLKFIGWLNDGCDELNLAELRRLGIQLSNVRRALDVALAEWAFAFMLALTKRL